MLSVFDDQVSGHSTRTSNETEVCVLEVENAQRGPLRIARLCLNLLNPVVSSP